MKSVVTIVKMDFVVLLVLYAGSAWSLGATNQSGGSLVSAILPPAWVSASDGGYADRIVVSWAPWGSFTNNCIVQVYRCIGSDVETAQLVSSMQGKGSAATPSSFVDYGANLSDMSPYIKYYYWVKVGVETNKSIFGSPQYEFSSYSSYCFGSAGLPRYKAASADYDGDGRVDFATCQELTGNWQFLLSSTGYARPLVLNGFLGGQGFVPMPMDYDNDGKVDPAVYNEETGEWRIRLSGSSYFQVSIILGN